MRASEVVSYQVIVLLRNTQNAAVAWKGITNFQPNFFPEYIDGLGYVHAGALIPAYIKGTGWLNGIANP
jgi:hypothetical protein